MLVMRTIKDPPDDVSGFTGTTYGFLDELVDLTEDLHWVVKRSTNVQITSQVERTEPEELVVEEHSDTYTKYDSDTIEEAISAGCDEGEHTPVEGEDTGALEADMEDESIHNDADTKRVDGTGSNTDDQEDTSGFKETFVGFDIPTREDDLDIQFVRVITT